MSGQFQIAANQGQDFWSPIQPRAGVINGFAEMRQQAGPDRLKFLPDCGY